MALVIRGMRRGGCGWTASQGPRMRAGAVAMLGTAMPMPHQLKDTTAEKGAVRLFNSGRCASL
eukprot:8388907-Pyramimonas_sp.AAC.1